MNKGDVSLNFNGIQRTILIFFVLLFPFTHFSVSLPVIGRTPYSLFLLLGYFFFAYEIFVCKFSLDYIERNCRGFLLISTFWAVLTGVLGIVNYAFFEQINLTQMENFKNFYDNVSPIYALDELKAIQAWLSYKEIRSTVLSILYTYLVSLWIYHIYRSKWKQAFHDFRKILLVLCSLLVLYSLFEVDFLTGGTVGKTVLETINPLYMKIADAHGWWPRLLWNGQLRSLFCEPSFFGIFSAMAMPVYFSFFYEKRLSLSVLTGSVLYFLLVIMLVLSKARTGTLLFMGELFLLFFWQLLFYRRQWKKFAAICLCSIMGFLAGLGILTQFQSFQAFDSKEVSVENYMEQNVTSVVGNHRSNGARKANVRATFQIGLEHPLFGIGQGLKDMYLDKNLRPDERKNEEVANWSKYMYDKGPLKSSYPTLNQLAGVFAEQGITGLLLFLFPIGYVVWKLWKKKCLLQNPQIACMAIALGGLCAAFWSNIAMIYFYVVMGYMLIAVHSDRGEKDE